jgi:hypothetical protein
MRVKKLKLICGRKECPNGRSCVKTGGQRLVVAGTRGKTASGSGVSMFMGVAGCLPGR